MFMVIPLIVLFVFGGIFGILLWRAWDWENDIAGMIAIGGLIVGAFVFLVTLIGCPVNYYSQRTEALRAESYYQQTIMPHVIEEADSYVVVDSLQAGIWQAGEMNVATYNAYLKDRRYWDGVPIIGTVVYGPPDYLKYVRIASERE